jgi:hypothetical protein
MCETFLNIVFVLNGTKNYDYAGFYLLYLLFAVTTVHLQCMDGGWGGEQINNAKVQVVH